MRSIDFESIENKDYWAWYIAWYLAEMTVIEYSADKAIKWISKYSLIKFRKFVDNLKTWTKVLENLIQLWLWNRFRFDPVFISWYTDEVADVLKSYETKGYIDEVDEWFLKAVGVMWIISHWNPEFAINRWKLHKEYNDKIVNNVWYSLENLSSLTKLSINIVTKIKSLDWWKTFLEYIVTKVERWIPLSKYDNAVIEKLNKMSVDDLHSIHYHHSLTNKHSDYSPRFNKLIKDEWYEWKLDLEWAFNWWFFPNHKTWTTLVWWWHWKDYSDILLIKFEKILQNWDWDVNKVKQDFKVLKIDILQNPWDYSLETK